MEACHPSPDRHHSDAAPICLGTVPVKTSERLTYFQKRENGRHQSPEREEAIWVNNRPDRLKNQILCTDLVRDLVCSMLI